MIEVLEEAGYFVIDAVDGFAGLKILQSDVRIDLLITDVGLPGGLNGRQVAEAARETRPNLKVLFVTGFAENAASRMAVSGVKCFQTIHHYSVDVAHRARCFSSESAPRPFHHGIRRRGGTIYWTALPSVER